VGTKDSFTEIVNAVVKLPSIFTVGTVEAIDEGALSVDVLPDGDGEMIKNVPIRVMRFSDTIGVTTIPSLKTEAIVIWLGKRPTLFKAQEWSKILVHDEDGFGITIEAKGELKVGVEGDATHPVAFGDDVKSYLESLVAHLEANCRSGAPLIPACPSVPDFYSDRVKTS
jgi:hypothetical protein